MSLNKSIPAEKPRILAVVGPTGSGKSALAIDLARKFNGEVVSADSRQIYREMDIGTDKPARENPSGSASLTINDECLMTNGGETSEQTDKKLVISNSDLFIVSGIPHHLLDIRDPNEDYSVADYQKDAFAVIDDILSRDKLPIICGGTGLYVQAIVENLDLPQVEPDAKLRQELELELKEKGLQKMFDKLVELDPEATYIVDPQNPRRVIRALEVAIATGRPFTAQRKKLEPKYDCIELGISREPADLRSRIDSRIESMYQRGLVEEVQNLTEKYGRGCRALDAIGYREVIVYLDKKISLEKSKEIMKINTWHYARRQMTWFKKDMRVIWIESLIAAEGLTKKFLSH